MTALKVDFESDVFEVEFIKFPIASLKMPIKWRLVKPFETIWMDAEVSMFEIWDTEPNSSEIVKFTNYMDQMVRKWWAESLVHDNASDVVPTPSKMTLHECHIVRK